MTVKELKSHLEGLGFGKLLGLWDYLYPTVNRAIAEIGSEHPGREIGTLPFFPERSRISSRIIHGGLGSVIEVEGGAVSFKLQGSGSYKVSTGEGTRTYSFSTLCREVTVELSEGGRIEFLPDGNYIVFELCFTKKLPSPLFEATERIGGGYAVDLSKLFPHFLYLTEEPRDELSRPIKAVRMLTEKKLFIPDGYQGHLTLTYRRGHEMLDPYSNEDASIDIDEGLEELLVLLCAYYLWHDDEGDLAQDYLEQYRELSASIKRARCAASGESYIRQNGW